MPTRSWGCAGQPWEHPVLSGTGIWCLGGWVWWVAPVNTARHASGANETNHGEVEQLSGTRAARRLGEWTYPCGRGRGGGAHRRHAVACGTTILVDARGAVPGCYY